MTEVAIKVTAESDAAATFTKDADAAVAAQQAISQSTEKSTATTKEGSTAFETMGGAAKGLTSDITSLAGEALQPLEGVLNKVGDAVKGLATGDLPMLAEGIGAAAVAGVSLGEVGVGLLDSTLKISYATGLSVEETHKLGLMFEDTGSSAQVLVRAGGMLTNTMTQYADSVAKGNEPSLKARQLTDELGISLTGSNGKLRDQGTVLEETLTKLGNMTDKTEAARIAEELFGSRMAGELLPVLAQWGTLSETAAAQQAKAGNSMEDAQKKATAYHTEMTSLKTTVQDLGITVLPTLTSGLRDMNEFLNAGGHVAIKDMADAEAQLNAEMAKGVGANPMIVEGLQRVIEKFKEMDNDVSHVIISSDALSQHLAGIAGFAGSIGAVADAFNALVQKDVQAAHDKETSNAAQAEANRLLGIATNLEGAAIPTKDELFKKTVDSTNATIAQKEATEAANQWMLNYGTSAEKAAASDYLAAEAKKASTAALKGHVATVEEDIAALQKQSEASDNMQQATVAWAAATGRQTDLLNNLIPSMTDLVNGKIDSYNATLRDNEAQREANSILGLQVDINGKVVKSFQQKVEAQKASILSAQEDAKATEEANRELGITSDSAKTTASSMDSLTTSLNANTTAWHQQSDAESQSAAKAKQPTSAAGGATSGGSTGASTGSGGSVAFFSHGSGGATSHASGLESVPYDGYPALLDKGERVQTAAEVARSGDTGGSNQPINITLQIPGLPDYIVRVVRNKALQGGFYGVPLGMH